jgi:hypothetical protein
MYEASRRICCEGKEGAGMQAEKVHLWFKTINKDVVSKFDTYMLVFGFTRSKEDKRVYSKLIGDHLIYLVLYVDDMLLIGNNNEIIQDVKLSCHLNLT